MPFNYESVEALRKRMRLNKRGLAEKVTEFAEKED